MSNALLGFGTLLQILVDDGISEEWETITERTSIEGPAPASDDVDVTSHDSTDAFKEFLAGLVDFQEVSSEGNFIAGDEVQELLMSAQISRDTYSFRIVIPDADEVDDRSKWTFDGYVKNLNFGAPYDTQQTMSCTIKIAGEATLEIAEES
jgi:predicted secreted protein